MFLYIAKRLGAGIVLALLVSFITFMLLSTSFEDVARTILGPSATPENVAGIMASKGWDRPAIVQYVDWLGHALTGDFGVSVYTSLPVAPSVLQRLVVTLSIIVPALIITAIVATFLGVWSASRGGAVDRISQGLSLVGYLFPGLLLAIGLVVIFAVQLKWLPATGFTPFAEDPAGWARSITIPVIVLVIGGAANMTAQVRGRM
ncbi:MAG: transporter permease, partial [Microbacterium sp.]|nr:transporter permease [Microbacterium sp.]